MEIKYSYSDVVRNLVKTKLCPKCGGFHFVYYSANEDKILEIGECNKKENKTIISKYDIFDGSCELANVNYKMIQFVIHNYNFTQTHNMLYHGKHIELLNETEKKIILMLTYLKIRNFEKHFLLNQFTNFGLPFDIIKLITNKTFNILYEIHKQNNNEDPRFTLSIHEV